MHLYTFSLNTSTNRNTQTELTERPQPTNKAVEPDLINKKRPNQGSPLFTPTLHSSRNLSPYFLLHRQDQAIWRDALVRFLCSVGEKESISVRAQHNLKRVSVLVLLGFYVVLKHGSNAVNNILSMCFWSKFSLNVLFHLRKSAESLPHSFAKRPNIFNPVWPVAPTGVALRHLQYNNVRLHIHSTGIFLCWQSLLLEPRSLFRFPQLCPEGSLHLALLCSLHCSSPLSLSPKCKSIGKRQVK